MGLKLANNAISVLASSITAGATSIALASGTGSRFPTLGAGDYFPCTIAKPDGTFEIVRVTARSGDTLTVTRAQEGTTALSFDAASLVEIRLTAATIDAINTLAVGSVQRAGDTMTGDLGVEGDINFSGSLYKDGVLFSGGAKGGGTNAVFYENDQTVTDSYTIGTGKHAISAGPITINDGAVVTIPDGSVWTVV